MQKLTTREAVRDFATLVNRAAFGHERFVLTRCGKPLAAVVPLVDLEQLEALADVRKVAGDDKAQGEQ